MKTGGCSPEVFLEVILRKLGSFLAEVLHVSLLGASGAVVVLAIATIDWGRVNCGVSGWSVEVGCSLELLRKVVIRLDGASHAIDSSVALLLHASGVGSGILQIHELF